MARHGAKHGKKRGGGAGIKEKVYIIYNNQPPVAAGGSGVPELPNISPPKINLM